MNMLYMSESEIVMSFLEAKNPKDQVQILADMNLCSKDVIYDVLKRSDRVTSDMLDICFTKKKVTQDIIDSKFGRNDKVDSKPESKATKVDKTKEVEEDDRDFRIRLLSEELLRVYHVNMELAEENRRLSKEVILGMNEILKDIMRNRGEG